MSVTADPIVQRARAEYLEMPGLCLTELQARRLWHLDPAACHLVLSTLVTGGFLRQTPRGEYVRSVGSPSTYERGPRAVSSR
ncbi:MAG TPA: hypothetical protein VN654_28790 [Vicinamibacterales bacterium]|jgi:hypothetical protein|nr:hypothetical protein [Vicinamibacterales bacterium]